MLFVGSISLGLLGCSSEENSFEETGETKSPAVQPQADIDLSEVFEKRIEGKSEEAIALLRSLNDQHPASVEVMIQLARSLMDSQQFALAAFRYEQALSLNPDDVMLAKEAAEAHFLANDFDSAIERYRQYLTENPSDSLNQIRFARMLAEKGLGTEAVNAFSKASEDATADDCLIMGNIFFQKNLLPQAKHWYGESSRRSEAPPIQALLGLLKVAQKENNDDEGEALIIAIEKLSPGVLESTKLANYSANLLRRRRLADFIARGMDARDKSVTDLVSCLLAGRSNRSGLKNSVTNRTKLPPPRESIPMIADPVNEPEVLPTQPENIPSSFSSSSMSLADAFAAPIGKVKNASGASDSPIELGQQACLEGSYTSALLHARDALKKNAKDASAWRLCSQAHFQLGETSEAEMTILEAIRHQPFDLEMRLDYLRIARETLPSKRYLQELEKVRELFPESVEVLWELARRYHIVENMPVTAAVLYRKIVQIAPSSSALAEQAEMELLKLRNQ